MLLILFSAVLWGTVGVTVASLYRLTDLSALTVGLIRVALAVPALVTASVLLRQFQTFKLTGPFIGLAALMGLATAAYQVCLFAAIQEAGVAVAALIALCTAPVWVAVLSAVVFRERLPLRAVLLLGAALCGAALLVYQPGAAQSAGTRPLVGAAWALGAALSYATLTVVSRALAPLASPLVSLTAAFSVATVLLLPLALREGITLMAVPWSAWGLLVYLGVVTTALGYVVFLRGLRTTPATFASVLTLLEPLVAVVLAGVFLGERLLPLNLLGAGLLVVSVGWFTRVWNKERGA
ncbi:DMT family transporter [Deinococcus multiflagellatus]|uniref:DMT family transporter n=1 Tax=Deinococcus multiflagellatus TaxID=1656887 RepID=A0ABW1ZKL4_9DEIO